jgi:peroxiredoxin
MNRQKSLITIFFAAGIFLVGIAIIMFLSNNPESDLQISSSIHVPAAANYPAPEFNLHDLQENAVSLSNYRGLVVLVNNWATWCPPCKAEMPELLAYYEAHINDGFVLVAIESGEPLEEVTAFVQGHKLTFPVWLDPHGVALEAFNNWNLPSSYVIDRDGTVRYSWTGPVNLSTLEIYITPLLEE